MNKLFVYGIFLSEHNRLAYGMANPVYATVKDYITVGNVIVQAIKVPSIGAALTGLVVDVDPTRWGDIDSLEAGYARVIIKTTDGQFAYMYTAK